MLRKILQTLADRRTILNDVGLIRKALMARYLSANQGRLTSTSPGNRLSLIDYQGMELEPRPSYQAQHFQG
jgi:hypothetical protein